MYFKKLQKHLFYKRMTFLCLLLLFSNLIWAQKKLELSADPKVTSKGVLLFKTNCSQCHSLYTKSTGPALIGITERRELEWIIDFVKGPLKKIHSNDSIAIKLALQYSPTIMPNHDFLRDEEIIAIMSAIHYTPKDMSQTKEPTKNKIQNLPNYPQNPNYHWGFTFTIFLYPLLHYFYLKVF